MNGEPAMNINEIDFAQMDKWVEKLVATMPQHIQERCILKKYEKNDVMIEAGSDADKVFILLTGTVKIMNHLPTGIIYTFATVGSPSLLGEEEALAGVERYRGEVKCYTKCSTLYMHRDVFLEWMSLSNAGLLQVVNLVINKNNAQKTKDRSYLFLSGTARLAYCLVENYNIKQKNGVSKLKITRNHIADETGCNVKTVNRCITKLKEADAITVNGQMITIDEEQLKRLIEIINDNSN